MCLLDNFNLLSIQNLEPIRNIFDKMLILIASTMWKKICCLEEIKNLHSWQVENLEILNLSMTCSILNSQEASR